jgi:hypothetical protein
MSRIPSDYGGLIGYWPEPEHAVVAQFAHGEPQQAMRLTPLNALQFRKLLDTLIADGKAKGYITAEHERQSAELPTMPPDEVDMGIVHRDQTGGL